MYFSSPSPATPPPLPGHSSSKKKRRPAGTPDPDAEVVALSPKTLLESDRYVCEICGQGFQRDQNLQMHRRRHKVPWKLVKRDTAESAAAGGGGEVRKRVYVCPESSCLHHDPAHALGDLVGIKKHFRRKHSAHKQWVCARCGKGYAVQSDYKAHLKTCGTRGHTCDCGRVFSRVESFIEHQDECMANQCTELQLLPTCNNRSTISTGYMIPSSTPSHEDQETIATNLKLSIGPEPRPELDEEKVRADEARAHAKRQMQMAELEFNNAKRIRLRAQAELDRALALREQAINQINVSMLAITCYACKQRFSLKPMLSSDQTSPTAASYMSSVVTEGEGENDNQNHET